MSRWNWFLACALLGLVMLGGGLLIPAHLRAVDASVIEQAGRNTPSLNARGLELVRQGKLGAAALLSQAAQSEKLPGRASVESSLRTALDNHPDWRPFGGQAPRGVTLSASAGDSDKSAAPPFAGLMLRDANRRNALNGLAASSDPAVRALLQLRSVTNTVIFPPSHSSAGQVLDATIATTGLLLSDGRFSPDLSSAVLALATQADRGGGSEPIENLLMDVLSLSQRFNWNQLAEFVGRVKDPATLTLLAGRVRSSGGQMPALFSAVELSGKPGAVARYLRKFGATGLADLAGSLRFGAGAVRELLQRDQRLYNSGVAGRAAGPAPARGLLMAAANFSLRQPWIALSLKWILYFGAGFLLAMALHFARPSASALERPLQVRGFHVAREILFALGFLLVVLLLSEPFLAQESQKAALPFRLRLGSVAQAVQAASAGAKASFMNQENLLVMLLFFVLQALLYIGCVVKLAEIRRQRVAPRLKVRLLENEEHLFDAGLYLGFLGTIISFIIYSMVQHHQIDLMVAYSSTSFGILFVSFFKIFHLRPVRRRLLLEADASSAEEPESAPTARPSLASP